MKKLLMIIGAVLLLTLAACGDAPQQGTAPERSLFGTVLADDFFPSAEDKIAAGAVKELQFYMANSAELTVVDQEKIREIWELLGKVSAGNAVSEPGIDDGLIVFDFLFADGDDYMIAFLTTEYVYGDDSVYEVNDPAPVKEAIKKAMAEE